MNLLLCQNFDPKADKSAAGKQQHNRQLINDEKIVSIFFLHYDGDKL